MDIPSYRTNAPATLQRPSDEDAAGGADALRRRITDKLRHHVGHAPGPTSERDWFVATALAVRDAVVGPWLDSTQRAADAGAKRVYYLSLEFLPGRMLLDAAGNLGLAGAVRDALAAVGVDPDRVLEQEPDPALGNGGLGRLAACFMESMATLGIPAIGYGIRYEQGLFKQVFENGVQKELPDDWLALGNPWEFARPALAYPVGFGGEVSLRQDAEGRVHAVWEPAETLSAVAYDTPVIGEGAAHHATTLRLWSARAALPLHLDDFNRGDHVGALRERVRLEAISRVLYPGDESPAGQELRLRQQFFFVTASLQDLLRHHLGRMHDLRSLPDKAAIQLNDTHPAMAVAELMRLLVDVHGMEWDEAWRVTVATISYTNHTLMPEALETWPVALVERLLPRHLQIIYRLNAEHLERVRERGGAYDAAQAAASLIDERFGRRVRMGQLAFVGSHAVNGVSALHTGLLRRTVFGELDAVYPGRISNKTNGITFRRWLHRANPGLTRLLADALGERVLRDPEVLADLAGRADDRAFQDAFAAERRARKEALARVVERAGVSVDPDALFDVHVKRIHEYKRQLLNILQAVAAYHAIRDEPGRNWVPRVKILAGKAAPSYHVAKQIIRLAHDVARTINTDPAIGGRLKLAFLPNYGVSLAELIIPAADLSEQISTAGMEASGTGNMKLALNGALTIGTLDGANVEIRDRVGAENFFLFGLTADEVAERRAQGLAAHDAVWASPALERVLRAIGSGAFSPPGDPDRYRGLVDALVDRDRFLVAVDFDDYCRQQAAVDALWQEPARWWRAAVLNTAGVGWFSSDRTVAEYAAEIWRVPTAGA
jgi:glycogen phosphorylase